MWSAIWLMRTTSEASRARIRVSTAAMSAWASDWTAGRARAVRGESTTGMGKRAGKSQNYRGWRAAMPYM